MLKLIFKTKAALIAALLLFAVVSCTPKKEQVVLAGKTMGTSWSAKIVLVNGQKLDAEGLQRSLEDLLQGFNQIASTYIADSEISRFNQHQSLEVFVASLELATLFANAKTVHQQSQDFLM